MSRVCVSGAAGFIGRHLCRRLKEEGHYVRGVDIKRAEFDEPLGLDDFQLRDLRQPADALAAVTPNSRYSQFDAVFNLAADMGGIDFIHANHATISRNNTQINLAMLEASRVHTVGAFIFSSSACVYPVGDQNVVDAAALYEAQAWPADPEPGYGLEKLYTEQLCKYYREEFKLNTQVVRFHNVGGILGSWQGGREKAPAAACRKVAAAPDGGSVVVWGDGQQSRSFMAVNDCVEGLIRLWKNGYPYPINLGTSESITINELYRLAIDISGKQLSLKHDLTKPQGVRGRNSDNTLIRTVLGWEPTTPIHDWLPGTYHWINEQIAKQS